MGIGFPAFLAMIYLPVVGNGMLNEHVFDKARHGRGVVLFARVRSAGNTKLTSASAPELAKKDNAFGASG